MSFCQANTIDMTKIKMLIAIGFLIIFANTSCNNNFETSVPTSRLSKQSSQVLTTQQWLDDFEELYSHLKSDHRNLYHTAKPSDFEHLYLQIKNDILNLSDYEIIVQFARFVALTNDGHTRLTLPLQEGIGLIQAHSKTSMPSDSSLVFRHLPVEFYWFDDGLYVTKATEQFENLIGKKVLKINETYINEALDSARAISHYDNEYGYKLIAPSRLSVLEILKALKITKDDEIVLTVEQGDITKEVGVLALSRFSNSNFLSEKKDTKNEPPIISRQKNDVYYWYEYLEDKKTVYLQINQMNDASTGPDLIKFIGNLNSFIKSKEVNRLILDLRNNFGGDNTYSLPIANLIIKNPNLNKIGSFYTLIGRKTFSAAQDLTNDLRKWTNVIFVGEPTGASPNSYGDSRKTQLSNSNLTANISTIYWRDWTSDEKRQWNAPDIPIPNNASDYFYNRDSALTACLTYKVANNLADTYANLYETGGMETAKRIYLRVALDWERTPEEISSIENKLVEWMSADTEE